MSTCNRLPDGIACGNANRDRHHTTVLSQFGYSIIAIVLCSAQVLATPLFDDHAVLDVTLTGPVSTLIDDKGTRAELPFVLTTGDVEQQVAVRVRGQSRLQVCDFPPLRLRFAESVAGAAEFDEQEKLKLVTHCRHHDQGEQNLLEEFAAYRILNELTEMSYRVRLLRISYVDTDEKLKEGSARRYGFVIEPVQQLADRLDATIAKLRGAPKERHDRTVAALVYIFQYLIGNTDWGLVRADSKDVCCHNVSLLERDSVVYFVPYDFDRSGLVNPRYASPDPTLRISRVTQRLYRGLCADPEYLQDALQTIRSKQADILDVLKDIPGLTAAGEETASKYLTEFFSKAENEEKLLRSFERRCL